MDRLDGELLMALQDDFPLGERPYGVIAERVGSDEGTVFGRMERFVREGMVRRLGPRYDHRRLGLSSTLVAAEVGASRLEAVAGVVCQRSEVTHCYERAGGKYNLWFTVTTDSEDGVRKLVEELRGRTGIAAMHSLPAEKVYKLGVRFVPECMRGRTAEGTRGRVGGSEGRVELSEVDWRIVGATRRGLPTVKEPYGEVARGLGLTTGELIERLEAMCASGVIRTMGVVLDGRRLGYRGNALVAWGVTEEECDRVGGIFSEFDEVSHGYRRPGLADFPYRLYTMVHGRDALDREEIVGRMAVRSGVAERVVMETRREFKKTTLAFSERGGSGAEGVR